MYEVWRGEMHVGRRRRRGSRELEMGQHQMSMTTTTKSFATRASVTRFAIVLYAYGTRTNEEPTWFNSISLTSE